MEGEEDLYSFEEAGSSGYMPPGTAMFTASATGGAGASTARPTTSAVRGAGFTSHGRNNNRVGSAGSDKKPGVTLEAKETDATEVEIKKLEAEINKLMEDACALKVGGDANQALEKSKNAGKKERILQKQRATAGLEANQAIKYSVFLNLAVMLQAAGQYEQARKTYTIIAKNKANARLKVNIANCYYEEKDYAKAVKFYRMALDQVPPAHKDVRASILRNLGNAFVCLGRYSDAIQHFDMAMTSTPDFRTGSNLLLCFYALGDKEKMKEAFQRLLTVRPVGFAAANAAGDDKDDAPAGSSARADSLRALERERRGQAERAILQAAKLLAPVLDARNPSAGYDFAIECLKESPYADVAAEVEITKALSFLQTKDFGTAIETLKGFEKDVDLAATAATDLSFLYFHEGDYKNAEKHAQLVLQNDRYNAKALVNRANCLYARKEYEKARDMYTEAVSIDVACTEALYNLGLCQKQLGAYQVALQAFEKLNNVTPHNPEVVFQIAHICELLNDNAALEWYDVLRALVPHDPSVLLKLGQVYMKAGDRAQALACFQESYRYYPSNIVTLTYLGGMCAENKVYDQAIRYFERAAQIQPQEVKWRLMIASCLKRMGQAQRSIDEYKAIHAQWPDNVDCLVHLERLHNDLGMVEEAREYGALLRKMQKQRDAVVGEQPQYAPEAAMPADPSVERRAPTVPDEPERRRVTRAEEDELDNQHLDELLP